MKKVTKIGKTIQNLKLIAMNVVNIIENMKLFPYAGSKTKFTSLFNFCLL